MRKRLFTLILFLTVGHCELRVVTVPEGPLVRVEGQPVSLPCRVSQYEGPLEQVFEWQLVQGDSSFQLISFMEASYTDSHFSKRVADGDISLVRLAEDAAELRIRAVRESDGGTYICSTPSTDVSVSGNYEASVQLQVIKDSLQVGAVTPPAVIPEGAPLELLCKATRDLKQRTYLSMTWSIKRGTSSSEDILSLGPDGGVQVGAVYAQRYADARLRPQTCGNGTFSLLLAEALPSDQGRYTCTAREWVPEGHGVWQNILERKVELSQVEVTPFAQSLRIFVEKDTTLNVDDTLCLTCSIMTDSIVSVGLEVTWLIRRNTSQNGTNAPKVLAHMSRDGVVANGSGRGDISCSGPNVFQLLQRNVDQSDSGFYTCKVQAWLWQGAGHWYQATEKTSDPVKVLVTMIEPAFNVTLHEVMTPQFRGEPMELECQVTGTRDLGDAQLGVSWYHHPGADSGQASQPVAALDEQGTLMVWEEYRPLLDGGLIVLSKVKPLSFRIRFLQMQDPDRGAYHCVISTWARTRARDGSWLKTQEVRSDKVSIQWEHKKARLGIIARRLREASRPGSTFEMSCQVISENLLDPAYSVLIRMEETVGSRTRKIVSLNPDLVLQLEDWSEPDRLDGVVLHKTGPKEFRFRLYGAQVSDRGFYSCDVTAWKRNATKFWTRTASAESNKVQIAFAHSGPSFNISIHSDTTRVYPGETTKIDCKLGILGEVPNTGDLSYEVQWYLSSRRALDSPVLLASVDRWGVVRKSPRNSSSDCSLEHGGGHTFTLSLHHTQDSDAGEYQCRATPWLRSTSGAWNRGHDLTSPKVFLMVHFALWDSMKLPLLYGVGVTLVVGLFSLLLGFVCTHCWCCKVLHKPGRTQNHLMDLEMD